MEVSSPVRARLRAHRRWVWLGIAALTALAAFVLVWFQPQKLWIDDRVDEAAPTAAPSDDATTGAPAGDGADASTPRDTAAPGPRELARGTFVSIDHHTEGVVAVLDTGAGRVVRLEGLDTSNGPDLFVYLTANPQDGPEGAFDDDYVSLGRLKGNEGNQNYEVPDGVDLEKLATVVIWCDRFNSAFGAADLSTA